MNIKNLKPSAKSRFRQGYFDISKSTKYVGEEPVIYRSSLECTCFNVFEKSDSIVKWSSEPDFIKIYYMFDGKQRRYNIDAYVELQSGAKILVEIKPMYQCFAPDPNKIRNRTTYNNALRTYNMNIAKWEAAHEFAINNNMSFKILTDDNIKKFA